MPNSLLASTSGAGAGAGVRRASAGHRRAAWCPNALHRYSFWPLSRTVQSQPAGGQSRRGVLRMRPAVASSPADLVGSEGEQERELTERAYLAARTLAVTQHFPTALGIDDFMQRVEIALFAYGFNSDNSIGTYWEVGVTCGKNEVPWVVEQQPTPHSCPTPSPAACCSCRVPPSAAMVNLCRDEITVTLKHKIDHVFGSSFNTNGLGGVLTCGVSGVKAGLSHAPCSQTTGREKYVFFSFPHISIDSQARQGVISRPGRRGDSCACGALKGALDAIQTQGLGANCKVPGVHEPLDPEMTILKQRLARRLRFEGASESSARALSLVDLTGVAERTITDDLEHLISLTVDPSQADYAVVTGVQIHSWGVQFDDASPNLEYVAPASVYTVINGHRSDIDLLSLPALTPRQTRLLSQSAGMHSAGATAPPGLEPLCAAVHETTLREIDPPYVYGSPDAWRRRRNRLSSSALEVHADEAHLVDTCRLPSWQARLRAKARHRGPADSSIVIDQEMKDSGEVGSA